MKTRAGLSVGLGLLSTLFAALPGACSGSGNGGSGAGGSAPDAGAGGDVGFDAGGGDGSAQLGCSADLRSVIDANGMVVTTCPPDQGCAGGACVAACAAAAATQSNL